MATQQALKVRYDACLWLDQETNLIIACARPLDVVSAGEDEDQAKRNLDEALQLFLEVSRDMGTLDQVLQESGYRLVDGVWEPPLVKMTIGVVEVPA